MAKKKSTRNQSAKPSNAAAKKPATPKKQALKRETLLDSIATLEGELKRWRESEDQQITREVYEKSRKLVSLTVTEDVEKDARSLVLAIDEFGAELREWKQAQSDPTEINSHVGGKPSLWTAWNNVLNHRTPPEQCPRLEPLSLLITQYGPMQAAKTYGWKNPNGTPDTDRVMQHRNDKTDEYEIGGINPRQTKLEAEIDSRWSKRVVIQENGKKQPKHAPESLDELILMKPPVPVAQILKMKPELTAEEVYDRAEFLGISVPGVPPGYAAARNNVERERDADEAQRREDEKIRRFAKIDGHEGKPLDERVVAISEQGLDVLEIVEYLGNDVPITPQDVADVLTEAQKAKASSIVS